MAARVAIIAGGSGAIGRAVARRLCGGGIRAFIGYRTGRSAAEEEACAVTSAGGSAEALHLDLTDASGVESACRRVHGECGRLDIIVNAAAVNRESPLLGMEDGDFREVAGVILEGAFRFCREAAKYMVLNRWGRIINISSVSARIGGRGQANYAASKAGLERLTEVLALELGRKGVTANCVAPGVMDAGMSERIRAEHGEELLKAIPLRRYGKPEEVASAVAFLASDDAGYINGQVIRVDGGLGL